MSLKAIIGIPITVHCENVDLISVRAHWELFPGNRFVTTPLLSELTGILVHAGYGAYKHTLDRIVLQPTLAYRRFIV